MKTHKKVAILLGATGLTGSLLLRLLLDDERYEKVILFSRTAIGFSHSKVDEHLIDVFSLADYGSFFKADVVFCCIGTTKSKTPNKELYRKIDYGIPVAAAKLCQDNGIGTFIVVSALGAKPDSPIFYNKTKGEMEEQVLGCRIPKTHILQPALISGQRSEKRIGEWLFKQIMKGINHVLVGSWNKYRSISPETIAKCMIWLSHNLCEEVRIESDRIQHLVDNNGEKF